MTFNDKVLFSMFFIFAIGVSCGAFFEVSMEGAGKEQLTELLSLMITQGDSVGFFQSLLKSILSSLPVILLPFSVFYLKPLAILCPLIPFAKGVSLGFSATMLVEIFGLGSWFYIITTLLPQNLIQVPVICHLVAVSMVYGRTKNKNALHRDARPYFINYLIGSILIIISCLLEAVLRQLIL